MRVFGGDAEQINVGGRKGLRKLTLGKISMGSVDGGLPPKLHVVIVGPVNPPAVAEFLWPESRRRAKLSNGNYGTAPSALVVALLQAGLRVTVVSHRRGEGKLVLEGEYLTFIQVPSRPRPRTQALDMWKQERADMKAAIEASGADLVHAHWTYEWALAAAEAQCDAPVIVTIRDAPLTVVRYRFDAYRVLRLMMAVRVRTLARKVILAANSPYMARQWKKEMLQSKKIAVLPNIAPSDLDVQVAKSPHPLLVEIADSGPRKNIRTLLRAFSLLRAQIPEAELRMVGAGLGGDDALSEWASKMGLDHGVSFLGLVDRREVARHLAEAWVHVHAAKEESFGNTLLEAMRLGTPVLGGSRSGAVSWVIDNAGMTVDVSSARALADGMSVLLNDESLRSSLSARGLQRVTETFSATAVAKRHTDYYSEILAAREATK